MCDSVALEPGRSASGATLFAKNSDRKLGESQPFVQAPQTHYARGARVRCTHIEIAQVPETFAVMGHSPWWVWGFEHGVNEHAVAIGNHTVFSREEVEPAPGLIGMDLVRLGLERARTAREAVEVIATLLEAHGQGGAAFAPEAAGYHNSFHLADPHEVWALETTGRRWAARRSQASALSNHLSLHADWQWGSSDLEHFARTEQWWEAEGRIDVAAAYRNPNVPGRISEGRLRRSQALLAATDRHDLETLARWMRDHDESEAGPPRGATPDDERYYTLCMHSEPVGTTNASMLAALPGHSDRPWPVWVGFGPPCTGVLLPAYLDGVLPAALARTGREPGLASAWRVFDALREVAAVDPEAWTPWLRERWAPFEAQIEQERLAVEEAAAEVRDDPDEVSARLSRFMQQTCNAALAHASQLTKEGVARLG